ncbi:MAG: hypothetical protein WA539_00975, partial [Candidatus Sulfotelmatobacter sp.]
RTLLSLAGFQVIISGRFWVIAEVVDAKDEDAKQFYLKYGFASMPENDMRLFLPMATIDKLP